jgi:alpha-galactosidase
MPIIYQDASRTFFLQTPGSTYAFSLHPKLHLPIHRFWGRRIEPAPLQHLQPEEGRPFAPAPEGLSEAESPDLLPQELPLYGHGDFRSPALTVRQSNGSRLLELRYQGHRIFPGKPSLAGVPATYAESPSEAETLELALADSLTGLTVTLLYTVFRDFDAIARSLRITNHGGEAVSLLEASSACLDFPKRPLEFLSLPGTWARERHVSRQAAFPGKLQVESRRGTSSHQQHPFFALLDPGATEEHGEVFGFSLVYSGSFAAFAETDPFGRTRASIGLNPSEFSWHLSQGESFQTPEAVLVHSSAGLGAMSRTYHRLYRTRLCRGPWRDAERPCLINNWEATYFDFNEEKLLLLARRAKALGIELLVLDDGWFGKRDNDRSSLGDWIVDRGKLPDGIDGLARKINAEGLQFGLWFEPEMVSPDSELYRRHPDWCLHVPGRTRSLGRYQAVLDLSRPEVRDYVVTAVSHVLESAPIAYVKWDMNRHLTEVGSPSLPPERQQETAHRYVLGLYHIMDTLVRRFPHVLFEGCSGGGGRFDPGILAYMPQIWTSDNSDAGSRLKIQYGTSLVYPWSSISAHISAVPNHQNHRTTRLATRFHTALTGSFGYELDLGSLPEEELAEMKEQIALYKQWRGLLMTGDFYRLRSPFEGAETAWMVAAPDASEALVVHAASLTEANLMGSLLPLRGLDPAASYRVTSFTSPLRGDVLMHAGLPVPPPQGDFHSHCWHLKKS